MGASGINYTGVATLNINLGSGSDTFNVQSTNSTTVTSVNTGAGSNVVNVGSNEPTASGNTNGIQGLLVVKGSGADILNVDDTGNTTGQSGTLTSSAITGLNMGASGINYTGVATLNINLGSGSDTFNVNGASSTTVTTVNGSGGTNVAVVSVTGNFTPQNLTLLNFASATLNVTGNITGLFNYAGPVSTFTVGGSITSTGVVNVGSITTMTVSGNLAGQLNVTGSLSTLTVDGAAPGQITAGSVGVIYVDAGYGNSLLNLTVAGIQRVITATPVAGGIMPGTVFFAFVYDAESATVPQVAIRITDSKPVACSYNLALLVTNSSTAKIDLTRVDSTSGGATGISNISVAGDILASLSTIDLQYFTNLTTSSKYGVVLPADTITGVEVSGILPVDAVDVAGLEGLAFATLTTAAGVPINITNPLGSPSSEAVLWNYLGSDATVVSATNAFVVPFNQTNSVRLFAHDDMNLDMERVMTLTDETADNLPITAAVQIMPTSSSLNPYVQSVVFTGTGASLSSPLSVASITSTGALGDLTISVPGGSTVNGVAGLGNVAATSIFGSITVTGGGIYGVIQTTGGDLGAETVSATTGLITSVTSISSATAMTGQIIVRGNLISTVTVGGTFSGVIAAQGNVGVIQTNSGGAAVVGSAGALTRFGGITISGADSGQIISLGNVFGNILVTGSLTGRIAVEGQAVSGLASLRVGILGNLTVGTFASGGAIASGGLVCDATGGTTASLGSSPAGFVAAEGVVNQTTNYLTANNLLASLQGTANGSVLTAIFTNGGNGLLFDTGGTLQGLDLIETDLANLKDTSGKLSGTIS